MLAIECGTCRSGRTGTARLEAFGERRCLEPSRGEAAPRGEKAALGDEEAVGRDAQAGVVVEAAPAAARVVPEPDLLFELLVVALDHPPCLDALDNVVKFGMGRRCRLPWGRRER